MGGPGYSGSSLSLTENISENGAGSKREKRFKQNYLRRCCLLHLATLALDQE